MTTHVQDLIEPFFIVHWALGLWTTAQRYFRSINAGPHILWIDCNDTPKIPRCSEIRVLRGYLIIGNGWWMYSHKDGVVLTTSSLLPSGRLKRR